MPLPLGEPDVLGARIARARPAGARLLALRLHGGLETRDIDLDAAQPQGVLGEVEREAISVVQHEGGGAVEARAGRELARRRVEDGEAARQRRAKARLLEPQGLGDQRARPHELGVGRAHLALQGRDEAPHQRLLRAKQMRMAHGAAHDAAKHVAAPLIRRARRRRR